MFFFIVFLSFKNYHAILMGNFPPCHQMWCGKCYTSESGSLFHTASALTLGPAKENEREREEEKNKLRTVWEGKLRDKKDFQVGRDGDHLMVPFECDLCIFRKLRGTDPGTNSSQDHLLEKCIRRINLDAFWSRARSTVYQNKRQLLNSLDLSSMVGLQGSYEHMGPYELDDHCGYEVAITILLYSLKKGKHDKTISLRQPEDWPSLTWALS